MLVDTNMNFSLIIKVIHSLTNSTTIVLELHDSTAKFLAHVSLLVRRVAVVKPREAGVEFFEE